MNIGIEFIEGVKEITLPIIRLTKSRNGKTGTATFIFIQPTFFTQVACEKLGTSVLSLVSRKEKINSSDITIYFKDGKPFFVKAVFIFKNSTEWFTFLNFMREYSKETGLLFAEK
jgi:photosystem II protein